MFDAGWLNIGSLILGLWAVIIPVVNLSVTKKQKNTKWMGLSISSISACAMAVCLQLFYNYHLVRIEDWSALMDTTSAIASVSAVLIIVTILLNVLTLIFYRAKPEM